MISKGELLKNWRKNWQRLEFILIPAFCRILLNKVLSVKPVMTRIWMMVLVMVMLVLLNHGVIGNYSLKNLLGNYFWVYLFLCAVLCCE